MEISYQKIMLDTKKSDRNNTFGLDTDGDIVCITNYLKYRVYKKKLNKPEIAHRLCKTSQCTKFFVEIGCLGTDNVV